MAVCDESSALAPSPAVNSTRTKLAQGDPAVSTSAKRDVVKMPQSPRKSTFSDVSNTRSDEPNQSRAVQKLAMLFQPQQQLPEKPHGRSPLSVMSQEPASQQAALNDPIESLDALEEDIEAAEKSIAVAKNFKSTHKPATTVRPSKSSPPEKTVSGHSAKTARAPENAARRTLNQTITPTDCARGVKRRTVEALNTPEKPKKSTKPATTSNFQLSSEATAAKLKAQREERQKRREEEEKKKQNELKAKSAVIRTKPAEVKTTVASRARLSLAAEKAKVEDANTETTAATSVKRVSTVNVKKAPGNTSPTKMPGGPAVTQGQTAMTAKSQSHKAVVSTTVTKAPRLSTLARSSRPINSPAAKNTVSSTAGRAPRPSVTGVAAKKNSQQPKPRNPTINSKAISVPENP